jgi:predicted RNA-binding Zn ribbon-like protein
MSCHEAALRYASRADIVVATLAADAIHLITGPLRGDLRACRAPGCVLMFLKGHPRREWCCNACGNRARQARHYDRTRRRS